MKRGASVTLLVVSLTGLRGSLLAQTFEQVTRADVPVPRVGITYMDLGSGHPATPAAEITVADAAPLFWRAGLVAGVLASAKGAVYGYGGLQVPLRMPLGLVARPSVSVGLYRGGEGMDLGHPLEFRSAFLVERGVTDEITVSALLYHLSNAGIGRRNPGMEAIGIGVTFVPSTIRGPGFD